jgi:hypothetical protein
MAMNPGPQTHLYSLMPSLHNALFWQFTKRQSSTLTLQFLPVKPAAQLQLKVVLPIVVHVALFWQGRLKQWSGGVSQFTPVNPEE